MDLRSSARLLLLPLVLAAPQLCAQTPTAPSQIRERLQDWRWMAQQRAFLFIGEIETMHPVRTHKCRAGFQEKLDYIVRDLLWSDSDDYVHNAHVVDKGFVDCSQKALPPPFREGSEVIVLCGARLGNYACLPQPPQQERT